MSRFNIGMLSQAKWAQKCRQKLHSGPMW